VLDGVSRTGSDPLSVVDSRGLTPTVLRVRLFVCTGGPLIRIDGDAEPVLESASCVAASGSRVIAGTRGNGVFVSADGGDTWEHVQLPEGDVFSVAIGAADEALYAGSEPSRLFVARDGARWEELEALQDIPSRERWSFPPRPWTHHVRWIAPDPHHAERLLVGIELGGLMLSEDGGATFTDHRPGAKLDAHSLAWHPHADGRAYQAAGDGAAWSRDGGRTWEAADAGRDLRYCWALAVDVDEPDRWYVSASSGPFTAHTGASARGRLYRREGSWRALELPPDSMPYALAATGGELVAGLADGRLLRSGDHGESWSELGARLAGVTAMAAG